MGALRRQVVSARDIADGAVRMPRRVTFDSPVLGKYQQTIVFIVFGAKVGAYDALTPVTHALGKVPTIWEVVDRGIYAAAGTAPGTVYTDSPQPFTAQTVSFRCTVPRTWAKIALR